MMADKAKWSARGLDVGCLQESSGNDTTFEKELLDAYLESCQPHLSKLPELLKGKNKKDAHFHVHTIKGSSLQIGGAQVGAAASKLEAAIAACPEGSDLSAALPALAELQAAFEGFVDAFKEYLAENHQQ